MSQLFRMAPSTGGTNTILGHVATAPPSGMLPVTNIYYDPGLGKMVCEYDDAGVSAGTIETNPPNGTYAITNIYFDPTTGVFVGEYDDGA